MRGAASEAKDWAGPAPSPFWTALQERIAGAEPSAAAPDRAAGTPAPGAPAPGAPFGSVPADSAAFGGVLGMALVGWALGLHGSHPEVRRSRLYNRYRLHGGWRWAVRLEQAGIGTICLKGLAAASVYPVPELRTMADADLLVRPADLDRALRFLLDRGFVVGTEPTRSPWGFIGDASAEPLVSPDGVNLDLHRHADSWPLHRGLPTEAVFAASRVCSTPEGPVRVPRPEHQLLIAASHAARDLFDAPSLKLLIDGAFLLRPAAAPQQAAPGPGFDWQEVVARARAGDSLRPLRAYLSLLTLLGLAPAQGLPPGLLLPPHGAAARLLRRLGEELLAGRFADEGDELDAGQKVVREVLLAASARTALRRNLRRLAGLVRPNRGMLRHAG